MQQLRLELSRTERERNSCGRGGRANHSANGADWPRADDLDREVSGKTDGEELQPRDSDGLHQRRELPTPRLSQAGETS